MNKDNLLMKHFYILLSLLTTIPSLCSEQKNKDQFYTTLSIKAESIVCFNRYAVIYGNTYKTIEEYMPDPYKVKMCYIYDLLEQKEINKIDNESSICAIIKHPNEPLVAILNRFYNSLNTAYHSSIGIYTVPNGEKIITIPHNGSLFNPIFNSHHTNIIASTGQKSVLIHNYTTKTTNIFTPSDKISLKQLLKISCNPDCSNESIETSPTICHGAFCGIHNFDGSYIAFNNNLSTSCFSVYDILHEKIIIEQQNENEKNFSMVFHPKIPHILAILSTKEKKKSYFNTFI